MPRASDLDKIMDKIDPMRDGGPIQKAIMTNLYGPEIAVDKLNALANAIALGGRSDLIEAWKKLIAGPNIPATAWGFVDFQSTAAYEELQKLADAIFFASRNPLASLTRQLIEDGIDADDLHTEGFLALIAAMKERTPEGQINYAEPLVRLLIAYDILLVVERELKAFAANAMKDSFGEDWIRHSPRKFRDQCKFYRSKREQHSAVNHDLFSYASITELVLIFNQDVIWQSVFDPLLHHTQKWFVELLNELTSIRSDVAHPRDISDDDFGWFILAARWMLSAVGYLPKSEEAEQ